MVLMALLIGANAWASASDPEEEEVAGGVPVGMYKESPMLTALVAAGELPPVDERLPKEPAVITPIDEVGRYGGTMNVFAVDTNPWNDLTEMNEVGSARLFELTYDGEVVGDIAESYELSSDAKRFTVYLREGARWSNGDLFTADDILFKIQDMDWNDEVDTWTIADEVSNVRKIDDLTVVFEMDNPWPAIELYFVQWFGGEWITFQPKQYLQKWHIDYNDDANALADEEGFDSWSEAFQYHWAFSPTTDIETPTMAPWRFTDFTETVRAYERNPYFYQVDVAAQQLPYVDRIVSTVVDQELYTLKIVAGEADIATTFTSMDNWTLYKESEESGGYKTYAIPGITAASPAFEINQNHEDPATRKVLNDLRFRQALSLAIDREEINELVYLGLGMPFQATALPSCSFYKEEWGTAFVEYDPDRASALLDEMGLTDRDRDGFRLDSDGKTILLTVEWGPWAAVSAATQILELIKEYWEDVGVEVRLRGVDWALFGERAEALDHIITVHPFETTGEVASYTWSRAGIGRWCPAWADWMEAFFAVESGDATLADYEGGVYPGEEPPEDVKQLALWGREKPTTKYLSAEYTRVAQNIYDYWAEQLYVIGTVGMVPHPYIANAKIGNIPTEFAPAEEWAGGLMADAAQLFFRE